MRKRSNDVCDGPSQSEGEKGSSREDRGEGVSPVRSSGSTARSPHIAKPKGRAAAAPLSKCKVGGLPLFCHKEGKGPSLNPEGKNTQSSEGTANEFQMNSKGKN